MDYVDPQMTTAEILEQIPRSTMSVEERDGEVGVFYSPGYGAGFWNLPEEISYLRQHQDLVLAAEVSAEHFAEVAMNLGLGHQMWCGGGEVTVRVQYMPHGTLYRITEYDGFERIETSYEDWQIVI